MSVQNSTNFEIEDINPIREYNPAVDTHPINLAELKVVDTNDKEPVSTSAKALEDKVKSVSSTLLDSVTTKNENEQEKDITTSPGRLERSIEIEDSRVYKIDKTAITDALESKDLSVTEKAITIINQLKKEPVLKELFDGDVGVFEGYTLEQHTMMVMNQFEKYFDKSNFEVGKITHEKFILGLILHDIGKPQAVREGQGTAAQHKYTEKIMNEVLVSLDIDVNEANTLTGLMSQDYIGRYLQNKASLEDTVKGMRARAATIGLSDKEFKDKSKIYFMVDASSYTKDSGGKPSLDHLFKFDSNNKKVELTNIGRNVEKMEALEKAFE